jgi:hypothetical protein
MTEVVGCKWEWHWRIGDDGLPDCGIFAEPVRGHAYAVARCPRYVKEEQWKAVAEHICDSHNGNRKHRAALLNARDSLTAFGGDPSELTEEMARKFGADMMQWALLRQIDDALNGE